MDMRREQNTFSGRPIGGSPDAAATAAVLVVVVGGGRIEQGAPGKIGSKIVFHQHKSNSFVTVFSN